MGYCDEVLCLVWLTNCENNKPDLIRQITPLLRLVIYLKRNKEVCLLLQRSLLSEADRTAEIRRLLTPIALSYGWTADQLMGFSEMELYARTDFNMYQEITGIMDSMQNLSIDGLRHFKVATEFSGTPVYVIKTREITRFITEHHLMEAESSVQRQEKPLGIKERNTLYKLIGALCKNSDIDLSVRGVATSLEKITELAGTPISNETIRQILNKMKQ